MVIHHQYQSRSIITQFTTTRPFLKDLEMKIEKLRNPYVRGNEGCSVSMIDLLEKINEIIDAMNGEHDPADIYSEDGRLIAKKDESEDERIRQKLMWLLQQDICPFPEEEVTQMLNYLEKQKEQKPNIELIQRSCYMEGYHDRDFGKEPKWIIKTGEGGPKHEMNPKYGQPLAEEQKPELVQQPPITYTYNSNASRDERLKAALLALLNSDLLKVKEGGYFTKQDLIEWVERIPTDKPAEWNEEDELIRNAILGFLNPDKGGTKYSSNAELVEWSNWLKSLRPQPKKELSIEKAIKWLDDTFYFLDNSSGRGRDCEITTHDFDSLGEMYDSFRKAVIVDCQPSWKPSEEQLEMLKCTIDYYGSHTPKELVSLYEQLKKL